MTITIKRAYENAEPSDGYRILVDRLWPRGVKKDALKIELWCKAIAPSTELRQWFDHDPKKFDEFVKRYHAELNHNPATQQLLTTIKEQSAVCLIYSAKDTKHNQAVVLQAYLQGKS